VIPRRKNSKNKSPEMGNKCDVVREQEKATVASQQSVMMEELPEVRLKNQTGVRS